MTEPISTGIGTGSTGTKTTTPPAYTLLTSESTVQVLSPTVVNDVLYCTIQTTPSGVIAAMPIPQGEFESLNTSAELQGFALGIEEVMGLPNVIAGRGSQALDANGLLQDGLIFTVEYVPPNTTGTSITGEATVPNSAVMGPYTAPGRPGIAVAQAAIDAVYAGLQNAAGQ